MNPKLFLADLEEKPARLRALAAESENPWGRVPISSRSHLLLLGMGSSHFANSVVAARLRAAGARADAELASADLLPRITSDTVVVAVSASANSPETVDVVARLGAPYVLLSNQAGKLTGGASHVVDLAAGEELGEVASRSYQHTLVRLLQLESLLTGAPEPDVARAAEVTEDLLAGRHRWLPKVAEHLLSAERPIHVVAPARRFSSAQQSALMLREGPRIPSFASETGDWSHVDVYLTLERHQPADYRMLLLGGSRWETELLKWTKERESTVVAVGDAVPGAKYTVRYPEGESDDVRLLTETLVAELLAAEAWVNPPRPISWATRMGLT